MRIIASILILLFLGSTLIPCGDDFGTCKEEIHFHASDDHGDDDHEDHCSPFCACACCGVQLGSPVKIALNYFAKSIEIADFTDIQQYSNSSPPIWHPPKV